MTCMHNIQLSIRKENTAQNVQYTFSILKCMTKWDHSPTKLKYKIQQKMYTFSFAFYIAQQ